MFPLLDHLSRILYTTIHTGFEHQHDFSPDTESESRQELRSWAVPVAASGQCHTLLLCLCNTSFASKHAICMFLWMDCADVYHSTPRHGTMVLACVRFSDCMLLPETLWPEVEVVF